MHASTVPLEIRRPPNHGQLTSKVVRSALVAALGALLFGFDTAVISGTTDWLKQHFALTDSMLGFTVASALIGTILGSIVVGRLADSFGRHGILYVLALFFLVSALGCGLAWNWWSFLFFRFLGGLAVGGASVVSPLYIAEISPAPFRGRLVAITQFNIVLGILLAYLSNYGIRNLHLGENECRWMFGIMALPSVAFFLLLFGAPPSPRWLVARGRVQEARAVFQLCGTDAGNVDEEIAQIQASLDLDQHGWEEPFFKRKYARPICLAMTIAAFNQLSGINAIIYYTAYIFKMGGAGVESALLQSVLIGLTLLFFTFVPLALIDHFGRRNLMIAGSVGYILSLSATAWAFYTHTEGKILLISLLVFIGSHSIGQGSVIWVFISEIFPNRVRARGQALGCFTHWAMAAAISWTFPIVASRFGGHSIFAFYAFCMVCQLVWVCVVMPETKGVTLEQIQRSLGID